MKPQQEFVIRVRPLQTRFYPRAKSAKCLHLPAIPGLHHALYYILNEGVALWRGFLRVVYYGPMFKSRCALVGRNFRINDGIPLLLGNMEIRIGDDVTISGVTTFCGSKMVDNPILDIGSGSYIGSQTAIMCGRAVHIGQHVVIANRVFIAADDGHPLDPIARRSQPPAAKDIREIWIGDNVWIGEGATILKGVRIGNAAIVGAHAVVTKNVPPFSLVAGNPAKVVRVLI